MAGATKINYKGKDIFYVDYRGTKEDEMIKILIEHGDQIVNNGKPAPNLTNISDANATPNFMAAANDWAKRTKPFTTKSAIVGITGVKSILLKGFNVVFGGLMRPFDTEEEAKEYLIKD